MNNSVIQTLSCQNVIGKLNEAYTIRILYGLHKHRLPVIKNNQQLGLQFLLEMSSF